MSFPEDMTIEILSKLPVKSLLRFRCNCKSWYALVKNPTFHSKHLKNQNNVNTRLIVHYDDQDIGRRFVLFPDETLTDLTYIDIDHPLDIAPLILGPYDGLFVLYNQPRYQINLMNLATREFRCLPDHKIVVPRFANFCIASVGCGFDPITNDCKFVIFREIWDGEDHFSYTCSHVTVYTLSNDSRRDFEVDELSHYYPIEINRQSTYFNGLCYWSAFRDEKRVILSFDMGNEVFQHTTHPDISSYHDAYATLGVYNDSLHILYFDKNEFYFHIWAMKEALGWTKQATVGPLLGIYCANGFWKNGHFFIETTSKQLLLCDPNTQELKDLGLHAFLCGVHCYAESLITITPTCETHGMS